MSDCFFNTRKIQNARLILNPTNQSIFCTSFVPMSVSSALFCTAAIPNVTDIAMHIFVLPVEHVLRRIPWFQAVQYSEIGDRVAYLLVVHYVVERHMAEWSNKQNKTTAFLSDTGIGLTSLLIISSEITRFILLQMQNETLLFQVITIISLKQREFTFFKLYVN